MKFGAPINEKMTNEEIRKNVEMKSKDDLKLSCHIRSQTESTTQ